MKGEAQLNNEMRHVGDREDRTSRRTASLVEPVGTDRPLGAAHVRRQPEGSSRQSEVDDDDPPTRVTRRRRLLSPVHQRALDSDGGHGENLINVK